MDSIDQPDRPERSPGLAPIVSVQDITSGLINSVFIIVLTVSYAVLIFSGPLTDILPVGIGYGLISATVIAIIFAATSDFPFATAGPDSKPVAVLAVLASGIATDLIAHNQAVAIGPTVLAGLIGGTLLTGAALYLLGFLRTAGWIRFVPFPVMGGFLAASGWLLITGSILVMTGKRPSIATLDGPIAPENVLQIAVGAIFVIANVMLRRFKHPLAFPAFLVIGSVAIHGVLHVMGVSVEQARASNWLIDIMSGVQLPGPWLFHSFGFVDHWVLLRAAANYAALIVVTASTLLLNTVATEVETRIDVDLDRELRTTGVSNLVSGLLGGMVGTLSLSRTLYSYRHGARQRIGGFLTGGVCLLTLSVGPDVLGLIPVPLVGAMLMHLGGTVLYEWLVKGWRRMPLTDYLLMLAILLVIVIWDFVAGIAVGVIAACVIFAISSSRIRVVKRGLSRSEYGSRVDRPAEQRKQLLDHGDSIQIMWLHGFLFFGSTNRLLEDVKQILASPARNSVCRLVILDFHQVLGVDSSAVDSLLKLRHFAEREGLVIAVSELPPKVEEALKSGNFLNADDRICRAFPNLDTALEWCEEKVLAGNAEPEEVMRSADEWLAGEIGGEKQLLKLKAYMSLVEYKPGEWLFAQDEAADALYIINSGRVTVLFKSSGKTEIRLRTMLGHTVVGEMGLYRSTPRAASVRIDEPTIVYRLAREGMAQMIRDDPLLAHAFHTFIICMLAGRLDFANREVASLQSN
jgi:sulfate permease, SulP family